MWKVYRINGLPWRGLSGLTGTLRLKAALICALLSDLSELLQTKVSRNPTDGLFSSCSVSECPLCGQKLAGAQDVVTSVCVQTFWHLDVICWSRRRWERVCVCVWERERERERDAPRTPDEHTAALCAFQLQRIFWSAAFISTLVNVSAAEVSAFDALWSPLISLKCHPVVTAEAGPPVPPNRSVVRITPRPEKLNHLHLKLSGWHKLSGLIIRSQATLKNSSHQTWASWLVREIQSYLQLPPVAAKCKKSKSKYLFTSSHAELFLQITKRQTPLKSIVFTL